jgi:putative membrane protein insertion efficiency factor
MKSLLIAAVGLYQAAVRPLLPPACRYDPSCSQYLKEALREHGSARGLGLGLRRICRCHPFSAGGADPVPRHG